MFKFQALKVWEKSVELANLMIEIADSFPQKYQFSFGDPLRKAGLSGPNNIAEGSGEELGRNRLTSLIFQKALFTNVLIFW